MSDIEAEFEKAIKAFNEQSEGWEATWAAALFSLSKTYTAPLDTRERNEPPSHIYEGLRLLARLFQDHSNGTLNPMAVVKTPNGRPRPNTFARSRKAFMVATVVLEMKVGKKLGRTSIESIQAATKRINKHLHSRKLPMIASEEVRSAWRNRARMGENETRLYELLLNAGVVTPNMLEGMASGVASSTFSKDPLF